MMNNKFKENLLFYRKQANMTQKMLAERLCVSMNNVGHWEKGRTEPDIDKLLEICEIFAITIEDLLK